MAAFPLACLASTCLLSTRVQAADSLEDELPVSVSVDGEPIAADFIVMQRDGKLYLPLVNTASLLSFVVQAPQPQYATGHRGDPRKRYYIVAGRAHAVIDERDAVIAPDDAIVADGMLWVTAGLAARLLPVHAELDTREFVLRLTSTAELPRSAERRRARQHLALATAASTAVVASRREPFAYRAIGLPSGDLQMLARAGAGATEIGVRALFASDLLWMHGAVFIAADTGGIDEARLRLTRESADGGVFGVPSLTRVEFGDVYGGTLPLIGGLPGGRGFALSSFPLDQQTEFDATRLEGDAPPGWQIEAYGNGRLLGFQQVGSDGRYRFDDLPLLFGENQYRLLLYGPGGERREEVRTVRVGADRVPAGEWRWRVAANQPDYGVFGFDAPDVGDGSPASSAELRFGVREWLTLGGFAARAPTSSTLGSPLGNFAGGLLRASWRGLVANVDVVAQDNDHVGGSAGIITRIASASVSARVSEYGGLSTPESSRAGALVERETFLRMNRPLPDGWLRGADLGLEWNRAEFAGGRVESRLTPILRHQAGSVSLEHELQYQRTTHDDTVDSHWQLRSATVFNVGAAHLRAQIATRTEGVAGIGVSGLWSLRRDAHVGFNYSRQIEDQLDDLSAYYARDFGAFTGRVVAGHNDSDGNYGLLEWTLSFAFDERGRPLLSSRRLASGGLVAPFVFLDRDNNGVFDANHDEPLGGVTYEVDSSPRPAASGADGRLLIHSLPTLARTQLGLDPASLGDPFYESAAPPLSFQARPGTLFRAQFPVVETGSIQGHVHRLSGAVRSPVTGVTLDLIDPAGSVVAQAVSQVDGYFVFERVLPGAWRVGVRGADAAKRRAAPVSAAELQIDDLDFEL